MTRPRPVVACWLALCAVAAAALGWAAGPATAVASGRAAGAGSSGGASGGASGAVIVAEVFYGRPGHRQVGRSSDGGETVPCAYYPTPEGQFPPGYPQPGVTVFNELCAGDIFGQRWVIVEERSARELAVAAADRVRRLLPDPVPLTSPPADRHVVNVGSWFATDASTWRPVSVTAWIPTPAGIRWATTTGVPAGLTVAAEAAGQGPIACAGPGELHEPVMAHEPLPPRGCVVRWRHSSEPRPGDRIHVAMALDWRIAWVSNTGGGGVLPGATTTADLAVRVREVQALVVG